MRTPTVEQLATITVLRNANSKTGVPECDRFSARNTRPSAVRTRERAHTVHASQAETSGLTLAPPRPCCSLAPSVTIPLYTTTVCRALRQTSRRSFCERRSAEPQAIYLLRGVKRCMLVTVRLGADFSKGCAHPAMQRPFSATHPDLGFVLEPSSHR
jgi:hypothetical protein